MAAARALSALALFTFLGSFLPKAAAVTCGELNAFYKSEGCCGAPTQEVSGAIPGTPACPYNFDLPECSDAEPQTPRDLTDGAEGLLKPKAATLTVAQAEHLPLVNVHFHLGAEHKSESYSDDTASQIYDNQITSRRLAAGGDNVRPGFMCDKSDLDSMQLKPYVFQHCKGQVAVGLSYEAHYVHSSAGVDVDPNDGFNKDFLMDGLGGAANGRGLRNPMIVVQAQVYQIVQGAAAVDDLLHGWTVLGHANAVMYPGSTTGTSVDNQFCSPYTVTWHVDKECHRVSPESFDNMCRQMMETYNMTADLAPQGSRKLVDAAYVVNSTYVLPLS